jgi:hypothetical protein
MSSPVGRTLLQLTGALAVVAGSFWVTLRLIDYWSVPPDPSLSVIHVVEATYGKRCQNYTPLLGNPNPVKAGNATNAVAQVCNNAKASCSFLIDLAKTSDPAVGCSKDFQFSWQCGAAPTLHRGELPNEAAGKTAVLSCP